MRPPRTLLFDTASLYFRAFHGVPETLRSPDGRPVNAVRGLLDFLARDVERTVARSGQQFENARALVQLAEAFDGVRDSTALRYAAEARELAVSGLFHEVVARADAVLGGEHVAPRRHPQAGHAVAVTRTPRASAVLRTLEVLPAARRYHGMAAC